MYFFTRHHTIDISVFYMYIIHCIQYQIQWFFNSYLNFSHFKANIETVLILLGERILPRIRNQKTFWISYEIENSNLVWVFTVSDYYMTYGSVASLGCIEPKLTINVFIIPEVGCIALRSIKFLKLSWRVKTV